MIDTELLLAFCRTLRPEAVPTLAIPQQIHRGQASAAFKLDWQTPDGAVANRSWAVKYLHETGLQLRLQQGLNVEARMLEYFAATAPHFRVPRVYAVCLAWRKVRDARHPDGLDARQASQLGND